MENDANSLEAGLIGWGRGLLRACGRRLLPTLVRRGIGKLLQQVKSSASSVSSGMRLACLISPLTSEPARRVWSLQTLASRKRPEVPALLRSQFQQWFPEDLLGQIQWYGRNGWESIEYEPSLKGLEKDSINGGGRGKNLRIAARAFFENTPAEKGKRKLKEVMESLRGGESLFIYAPHEFAFGDTDRFAWIPSWKDLYELAGSDDRLRVTDFDSGFDRNGFFHFVVQRQAGGLENPVAGKDHPVRRAYYFYMKAGSGRLHGHSNRVLSSAGLRALRSFAGVISEHFYLDPFPEKTGANVQDIAMGHYGPWITTARKKGALTILYGPGDRFRERSGPDYADMQSGGTFPEQYLASHLVIMQTGGLWRIESPWTYPGLCRWIHIPVSPAVFPRTKKRIASPGNRTFCFIGLYNERWKGSATARKIMERCPDLRFIAIGCEPFGLANCREYPRIDNRLGEFRRIVSQADYIVAPSREDAQPGTVAECGSLGLLPIVSEFAGYVLSFPQRINVDDVEQCEATLRTADAADEKLVGDWQALNARYIDQFHRPEECGALLRFYIKEGLAEFSRGGIAG